MKIVIIEENGHPIGYQIPTNMEPTLENAKMGIPTQLPDLSVLNWQNIIREMNNILLENNILTLNDLRINKNHKTLSMALSGVMINELYKYFREHLTYAL